MLTTTNSGALVQGASPGGDMEGVRVRITRDVLIRGKGYTAGEVVNVSKTEAADLIASYFADRAVAKADEPEKVVVVPEEPPYVTGKKLK